MRPDARTPPTSTEIRLGPFVLEARIGRGGMGVVWRGRHAEQGVPVAAKILPAEQDPSRVTSFRSEVHAIAALDHPNIVWLLDVGTVETTVGDAGVLAGSPYLVMELATGGTLSDVTPTSWDTLKEILLTLLDALGHAHARGVAHLDLKPGNVLLAGPGDLRPGLKLTDFGIAKALEQTQESQVDGVTGTLSYMAPELIRAEWRDYGPWTDLYSLGCLAWKLSVGRTPFVAKDPVSLMRAHISREAPRLVDPTVPVPPGFDAWVARLLHKVTWERFQTTADAAAALRTLGDPVLGATFAQDDRLFADLPTIQVRAVGSSDLEPVTAPLPRTAAIPVDPERKPPPAPPRHSAGPSTANPGQRGPMDPRVACIPADWRRPGLELRSPRLIGAGLSLYGVRSVPLVGREAERDALWAALSEVREGGAARVVTIAGAGGTGKTALARWLVERAREVGAATVMRCRFAPGTPSDEGLRRMLERFFRVQRLEPVARRARITEVLGRYDASGVVEDLDALLEGGRAVEGRARALAIGRVLQAVARRRALVVWLDDAQWGMDALRLADHVVGARRGDPAPILILLTYRTEALAERPGEANRLTLLETHRAVTRLELGPLGPTEHAVLARAVLPLSPRLAARLAERTAGNPQFLRELVGDWVERGELELGTEGFELRRGTIEVPSSMDTVWRLKVLRILEELPDMARVHLERAAILGREVDDIEWQLACDDPDGRYGALGKVYFQPKHAALRAALRDRLHATRIAEISDEGWTFSHAMLRHTLERMAQEGGRWTAHHRACAAMLAHRTPRRADDDERMGRHLVEAGDLVEGFEVLMRGVAHRERTSGAHSALGLLDHLEERMRVLPDSDPRWGRLWTRRAAQWSNLGEVGQAHRWAEMAWTAAERHGWDDDVRARAAFALGQAALEARRAADAERWFARAVALLPREDDLLLGRAWTYRSLAARLLPDLNRARALSAQALPLLGRAARSGDPGAWQLLGRLAYLEGDLDRAKGYLRKARLRAQERGDLTAVAEAWGALADVARHQGDHVAAEAGLRACVDRYLQSGTVDHALGPMAALALVHLARREWTLARDVASQLRAEVEGRHRDALACVAHAALSAAAAGMGLPEDALGHVERVEALTTSAGIVEEDLAWTLERAGDEAADGQHGALARAAWRVAMRQREGLGDLRGALLLREKIKM